MRSLSAVEITDTKSPFEEDSLSRAVKMARKLRMRLAVHFFFLRFLPLFSIILFLCGGAILPLRYFLRGWTGSHSTVLVAGGILIAVAAACLLSWKKLPTTEKLLVWLDSTCRENSGLLTAALEINPGKWSGMITVPVLPQIHSEKNHAVLPALAGVLFLAGCACFPIEHRTQNIRRTLDISEETTMMKEKLEVIEEEALVPEKELAEVKNTLDQLIERNNADDSGRTYELLEALARRVDSIGEEAAGKTLQSFESANMLSNALDTLSSLPADKQTPEAGAELAEILKQFAAENPQLNELLNQLAGPGENFPKLDQETMRKLAESMKNMSKEMKEKLSRLAKANLTKSRCSKQGECKNGKCTKPGYCTANTESLEEWLAENAPDAEALLPALCKTPGNGGISKGRGDARLNFTGNTEEFNGKKKDVKLEALPNPAQSTVLTHFAGKPSPDNEKEAAVAGNLESGSITLEQRRIQIYPEHRAAVEQYFRKNEKRGVLRN